MSRFADFQDVNIKNAFREYVRAKMQAQSVSRQLLIRRSGVSDSTIERILRADQNNTPKPSQTSIDAVLGALKLSTKDFLDYLYSDGGSRVFDASKSVLKTDTDSNLADPARKIPRVQFTIFHLTLLLVASVSILAISTDNAVPPQLTFQSLIEDTKIFYTLESHIEQLTVTIVGLEKQLKNSKDDKEIAKLQQELVYCENSLSDLQNSYDAQISMIKTTVLFLNRIKHIFDADTLEIALLDLSIGKYEKTIKIFQDLLNGDHVANVLAKELELLLLTLATNDLTIGIGIVESRKDYNKKPQMLVASNNISGVGPVNAVTELRGNALDKIKNIEYYESLFDRIDLRSDYLEVTSRIDENWENNFSGVESTAMPLYNLYLSQSIRGMDHFQLSGDTIPLEYDGIHDSANTAVVKLQRPDSVMRGFPRDAGFVVDWAHALNSGLISPQSGVVGNNKVKVMDSDVIFKNTATMPYVRFSHLSHTSWLSCENCHAEIFIPQSGENVMTMAGIIQGKHCGVCHGKVAFPLYSCGRCHNVSQTTMK